MSTALVTSRPVRRVPRMTAWPVEPVASYSSRMWERMNTELRGMSPRPAARSKISPSALAVPGHNVGRIVGAGRDPPIWLDSHVVDFWIRGLGFFELFSVPGRLGHLRRWAFQDVLLVAAASVPEQPPAMSVSFACVLSQVGSLADACRALSPHSVDGPRDTPWNTRDAEVITPESARVVFTAAKPFDPVSQGARNLEAIGIKPPGVGSGDNGEHG